MLNRKISIIVVLILLIASISAAAYIYFTEQSLLKILGKIQAKMQEVKSFHYRTDLETITAGIKANYKLEGDVDMGDKGNPRASLLLDLGEIPLPTGFGTAGNVQGELRLINQAVYLKISGLSDILGLFGIDEESIGSKWIKIDIKTAQEFDPNVEKVTEFQPSEEQIKQLKDLIKEKNPIKVEKVSSSELINNVKTHHYKIIFDKSKFKDFIVEASEIVVGKEMDENLASTFDEEIEKVKKIEIDIWTGKKDSLLYKASIHFEFFDEGTKTDSVFNLSMNLSNFNEPVNIVEPENVITFEEVFGNLFTGFMPTPESIPSIEDSDNDGLPDYLEDFYGTDINNPDTDGDGYKDGEEVENGYDPMGPGRL